MPDKKWTYKSKGSKGLQIAMEPRSKYIIQGWSDKYLE
jgi:hypothetical protein